MSDAIALEATGIRLRERARSFDFRLSRGEVVGLAGLEGHGQAAFLEVLAGTAAPIDGRVVVSSDGPAQEIVDARSAFGQGVVYLAPDRKSEGIFPTLSILDNFRILTLSRSSRLGFLRTRQARAAFARHRERLGIVLPGPGAPITSLSGGNQQKVLLARLLEARPRIMLLNDPTRGVDHPTRLALFGVFEDLATTSGVAIVVLSTEIDEIVSHCHRAVVFREGAPSLELSGAELTREAVLAGMFGLRGSATGTS